MDDARAGWRDHAKGLVQHVRRACRPPADDTYRQPADLVPYGAPTEPANQDLDPARGHELDAILSAKHLWYHVMDLAPGVVTPGWLDLRDKVSEACIPTNLLGKRALDLGMFDGFWAFELERRGATVIGIDIDEIPPPDTPEIHRPKMVAEADGAQPGTGFWLLKEHFDSSVERRSLNIYDLTSEAVGGPVDIAFIGSLLLHLRDPVRALEQIRRTLTPDGLLICLEPIDDELSKSAEPTARYMAFSTSWTWWYPNQACLVQWARTAGFTDVDCLGTTWVTSRDGLEQVLATVHARP